MRIGKRFQFCASHRLPLVSEKHKCFRTHGHNYVVDVEYEGPIADNGFCAEVDFFDVDAQFHQIMCALDHTHLNDVRGLENPTAELIARWIRKRMPNSSKVTVFETPDCWATSERDEDE